MSYSRSSGPASVRTITVPPSSTSVVTVPASTQGPTTQIETLVGGPVGLITTLPGASIVRVPSGATSIVSFLQNNAGIPTVSVLEVLGGPLGVTTMLPQIGSQVRVAAKATSLITLPELDAPTDDVLTLLGGATGLTTELPLETPDLGLSGDLGLLDNPDTPEILTTDVIEPPELATDPAGILDNPNDEGDAARPSAALAAWVAGAGAIGIVAFAL
jgi:hypothetical protein